MACPKCSMRLIRQPKRPRVALPSNSRTFHTSPARQRLGAFTYAQEWSTGTYHYNKALAKTLPVAAQRTDELLTTYATQQRRRIDPANPLYHQLTKQNIAALRRQSDRVLIGKTTAKEYVDRVELTAFVFDGVAYAEEEKEAFLKKRTVEKGGGQAAGGKKAPMARRRSAASMNSAGAGSGAPTRGPRRPGGFGGSPRPSMLMRRVPGIGAGGRPRPAGQPKATKS